MADETFSASGAFENAMVLDWINESIANYETEKVRIAGGNVEQTATVVTSPSTAVGVSTFPDNQVVSLLSIGARQVKSVWCVNPRYQLEPMIQGDRTALVYSNTARTGRPQWFQVIETDESSPVNGLSLRLWPPADSAYSLEVNYIPGFSALAADGDLFQYVEGTLDAVVCDVAMKVLERNDEADTNQYRTFMGRRDRAFNFLRKTLGQRRRGVLTVRDTRAEQYASLRRPYR